MLSLGRGASWQGDCLPGAGVLAFLFWRLGDKLWHRSEHRLAGGSLTVGLPRERHCRYTVFTHPS